MELLKNVCNDLKHGITITSQLQKQWWFLQVKIIVKPAAPLFPYVLDEKLWITLIAFVHHKFAEKQPRPVIPAETDDRVRKLVTVIVTFHKSCTTALRTWWSSEQGRLIAKVRVSKQDSGHKHWEYGPLSRPIHFVIWLNWMVRNLHVFQKSINIFWNLCVCSFLVNRLHS